MDVHEILERVAEKEGCDVLALPPLGDRLDVNALEQLTSSMGQSDSVRFHYCSYLTTVRGSGEVAIDASDENEGVSDSF